jgi:hypothetical protein
MNIVSSSILCVGFDFDYQISVVSIRAGGLLDKEKVWAARKEKEEALAEAIAAGLAEEEGDENGEGPETIKKKEESRRAAYGPRWRLCVEDPFELHHDLGGVIFSREAQERITSELRRAACLVHGIDGQAHSPTFSDGLCEATLLAPMVREPRVGGLLSGVLLGRACYNCGDSNHLFSKCPDRFKKTCFTCGEQGHVKSQCPRNTRGGQHTPQRGGYSAPQQHQHHQQQQQQQNHRSPNLQPQQQSRSPNLQPQQQQQRSPHLQPQQQQRTPGW